MWGGACVGGFLGSLADVQKKSREKYFQIMEDYATKQGLEAAISDALVTVFNERPKHALLRLAELLLAPTTLPAFGYRSAFNGKGFGKGVILPGGRPQTIFRMPVSLTCSVSPRHSELGMDPFDCASAELDFAMWMVPVLEDQLKPLLFNDDIKLRESKVTFMFFTARRLDWLANNSCNALPIRTRKDNPD